MTKALECLNEFHKQDIEQRLKQITEWLKNPNRVNVEEDIKRHYEMYKKLTELGLY